MLDPALLRAEILSDGELLAHEFNRQAPIALRDGGPWGQGYPEPLFDGEFDVLAWRVVGERHLKFELGKDGQAAQRDRVRRMAGGNAGGAVCDWLSGSSPTTIVAVTPCSW